VRYTHFGEGAYGKTEDAIRALLAEAGRARLGAATRADPVRRGPGGARAGDLAGSRSRGRLRRAGAHAGAAPLPGPRRGPPSERLRPLGRLAGDGRGGHRGSRRLDYARPVARDVYLVLAAPDARRRRVKVPSTERRGAP